METYFGLELHEFTDGATLRTWLLANHAVSPGVWVRVYKAASGHTSVTFEELLDQGLCFGWSESLRHRGDAVSYLQKFTPRRTRGTTSQRNRAHAQKLIASGEMTDAGLRALDMK
ncbi:MAG TPA: hypothetical protein VLF71_04630 [Candidatus Saccharimonadales bacterium]|nr:hypothetical protein [Candidatus Saccharimonadales bacterium]